MSYGEEGGQAGWKTDATRCLGYIICVKEQTNKRDMWWKKNNLKQPKQCNTLA